jgi:transcription antitermination factor NusG
MAVACPVSIEMTKTDRGSTSDNGLPWFALRVRSRRENAVASHLSAKGYEVFLPSGPFRKRWSDRIKKTDRPLFPGYLFCKFDPDNRLPVLKTPWLFQIVGLGQTPIPVDDEELDAIRNLVTSGSDPEPWPYVEVGQKVRIKSGTLRGVGGVLTEFKGNHKLVVSVTLLRRSVAVEIDSALVSSDDVSK